MIKTVYLAEAPRHRALGSLGNASGMLICQNLFPHEYDSELDKITSLDHDSIRQQDYDHYTHCFQEHTGTGDMDFQHWVENAEPAKILTFLKNLLKVDENVEWTGYRILGTINLSSGYTIWTLELFAKHPKSKTRVYSTQTAPQLISGSRYQEHHFAGAGKPM